MTGEIEDDEELELVVSLRGGDPPLEPVYTEYEAGMARARIEEALEILDEERRLFDERGQKLITQRTLEALWVCQREFERLDGFKGVRRENE